MPPLRSNTFVNSISQDERPDPVRTFLLSLLFMSISVGMIFYGSSFYFSYKSKMALGEIGNIEKRLETLPLDNMLFLAKKITTLEAIQKSEPNIPLFLTILGDSIEKNAYITSMSYSNKGKTTIVKLAGAADSYEDIVKQMDRLKNPRYGNLISKIELISISASEIEGVRKVLFSLDVSIDSSVRSLPTEIEEKEYDASKQVQIKKEEVKKEIISTSTAPTNTTTLPKINATSSVQNTFVPALPTSTNVIIKNI